MIHFRAICFVFLLFLGFGALPAPARADCVCYTGSNEAYPLEGSDAITDDATCHDQCIVQLDPDNKHFADGKASSSQTLVDLAATAAAAAASAAPEELPPDQCTCFCGTAGTGAIAQEGTYKSSSSCRERCDTILYEFSVCSFATADMPLANGLCWSQDDCAASNDGEWSSEQPAECAPGDHYCYPPPTPVELSVHLGETTTVLNIGTYINLVYTYGLGAAGLFAIVMIMIGGTQYIIGSRGGGGSEEVSKAKERIKNALTGLVLLLVVYVILYAVNPALTVFKTIDLPRIKPSLFVVGSCEDFAEKGYSVNPKESKAECGKKGLVVRDPQGVTIAQECIYDDCPTGGCANINNQYQCLTCADAGSKEIIEAGFKPSASQCSALSPMADTRHPEQHYMCKMAQAHLGLAGQVGVVSDACALAKVDCSKIASCADYAKVPIERKGMSSGTLLATTELTDYMMYETCTENPCAAKIGACTPIDTEEIVDSFTVGSLYGSKQIDVSANVEKLFKTNNTLLPSTYVVNASFFTGLNYKISDIASLLTGPSDIGCVSAGAIGKN